MNIYNYTPHTIDIYDEDGKTLLLSIRPSGNVARLDTEKKRVGTIASIPIFKTTIGAAIDVPPLVDDTIYIVSGVFRQKYADRKDLYQPGELLRNEAGQPIGCIGLSH